MWFDGLIMLSVSDDADNAFLNYYYGDQYVDDYLRRNGKIGVADAGMSARELVAYLSKHCGLWSDIEKNALTEDGILKRSASLAAIVDTGLCPRETLEKIGGFWRTTEKNTGLWSGKEYDTLKQAAAGTVELLDLMWEVLERRRAASLPVEV